MTRTKEFTEAEKTMIRALASQVLFDRLSGWNTVGATKSGRAIVEPFGQPTEAEVMWEKMKAGEL